MLSVKGIYEDGQVKLLEQIPSVKQARVIVTILEEEHRTSPSREVDAGLFDDLIGAVSMREDGSIHHDHYLSARENK